MMELFGTDNLIYGYSRAQAISDGELIDVTETAREAGFMAPVAMTRAAWVDCVEWTAATDKRKTTYQDEAGRLWDVLYLASLAAKRRIDGQVRYFDLHRVPTQGRGSRPRQVLLKMTIGPGDSAAPVITISQPDED